MQDSKERIASCFGSELARDLIWVESEDGTAHISGYVAHPQHSRSTNKHQYLFLNGRHIRDRALQHALSESYRGILLTGRHPIAFLHLQIPAEAVDVNVHPTKLEERFQDGGRLYSQLLGMLRNWFLTTDLTAKFRPPPSTAEVTTQVNAVHARPGSPHYPQATGASHPPESESISAGEGSSSARDDIVRWARGQENEEGSFSLTRPEPSQQQGVLPREPAPTTPPPSTILPTGGDADVATPIPQVPPAAPQSAPATSHAMQVHNRYLVTASAEGIVVIDQHALHERILYEHLREKVLQKEVEKQRLLVPEHVQLTPSEASAVVQSKQLLCDLGIDVEDFGGNSILVSSYPAMLANFNPAELIRQLAEQLGSGTKLPDSRDLLDELLHMISCKAAIKAGDRLAPEEIEALVEQRHLVQDSHHCPHGRPTTLVFTQKELDRRFQRT